MTLEIAALLTLLAPVGSGIATRVMRRNAALRVAGEFFKGRRCATCDAPIAEPRLAAHAPALRRPDGVTTEWTAIPSDQLEHAMATCVPVCWNCHVAEEFRRRYPELVTDRPAHASPIH